MTGWIGSLLLAFCGLPQAILSYKQGHSRGISFGFLLMWLLGEILTLSYIIQDIQSLPLFVNYLTNIICISVIVRYKFVPRSSKEYH